MKPEIDMESNNNNLDKLFDYMIDQTREFKVSRLFSAEFIRDNYNDDFYYRREAILIEELYRKSKFNS